MITARRRFWAPVPAIASLSAGIACPARAINREQLVLIGRRTEASGKRGGTRRDVAADLGVEPARDVAIGFLPDDEVDAVRGKRRVVAEVDGVAEAKARIVGDFVGARRRAQRREEP